MNAAILAPLAFAALMLSACGSLPGSTASNNEGSAPALARDGVLTNGAGMTLYTFDRDPADGSRSVCNGQCATNWPPLMADSTAQAAGAWSVVTRDDGSRQWAYKGKPLYLWAKDTKPGDRTGDGVNGVWQIAKP